MENKSQIIAIVGCMYTGKSTKLVDLYIDLKLQGKSIDAYKPIGNGRGGFFIVSRDRKETIPCNLIMDITEVLESKSEVIIIDEFQNFNSEQFKFTIKELKKRNVIVYIAGLNKNAVNEYFENYKILEKLSTKIELLKYKCQLCNAQSDFSCLIEFGKDKSFSTTKGAKYMNLCVACSLDKNILTKE